MAITYVRDGDKPGEAVWRVDWRPDGRNGVRRRKLFEGTYDEAVLYEQAIREEIGLRSHRVEEYKRLIDCYPEYLIWHKQYRSPRTHADFKLSWEKSLKDHFGLLRVSDIRPRHITSFVSQRDKKRANEKDIYYLRAFIRWMVEQGYAAPLSFRPQVPKYNRPLPRTPTPDEVRAVLKEIKDPLKRALVILMWSSGIRISSALALRWEHIYKDSFVVTLKGGRQSILPLPPEFMKLVDRKERGVVFPWKSIKGTLKGASKRAGIGYTMTHHMLRHAYATDTLSATGDLRLVQQALGHEQITTTTIYAQVQQQRLSEAADLVRALRNRGEVHVDPKGQQNT
ncbi:MAG: hypothetical protein AVO39_10410 [delta proteobacterium MLS_D]|jgi:integrase/recombinase XerC|nr:MAG: hypothetical protein AVO39_10410 [delta proteobacterium MLS_D]